MILVPIPKASRTRFPMSPDMRPVTDIERLVPWFRENNGWLNPDVEIIHDESHGFHVCAVRPLSSPAIVKCPLTLTISHLNLDHSQTIVPHIDSQLQLCLGEVPNEVLTYLLLIEQRCLAKQQRSAWQPYFDCLPASNEMTTTLWFDDDDLNHLQGTDLYTATKEKKRQLEAEYHSAMAILARLNVTLDPSNPTFEDYLWAFTIMSSRSFVSTYMLPNFNTFPILFPVLDILNHSTDAKINWAFDDKCFTLALENPASVLPKSQIFNNYAPKQNGELLMGYGFCIPENPIEQFAIKMRLPPDMVEAAKDTGLYNPNQVPFGLPQSAVDSDQSVEQHFLRPRAHPFGHYENNVPWLRGIPPWIMHSTFVATVMQLGHTPENTDSRKPTGMLVLHVLLHLYEAIRVKSLLFPDSAHKSNETYANVKQQQASIYRNGQAKVIHSILAELQAVLSNLRVRDQIPPASPALITTTEALLVLKAEYPSHHASVEDAMTKTYDMSTMSAAQEQHLWVTLLCLFAYLTLTTPGTEKEESLIHAWTLEFFEVYTLPSVDAIPDPTASPSTVRSTLLDFFADSHDPIAELNSIHSRFDDAALEKRYGDLPIWDDDDDVGLGRLGDKVIAWAENLVDFYAVQIPGESGRVGMYVRPYQEGGMVEEWVYGE
ncbi:unnamed protein product [Periconia digitata]|uniref:SET domain-containing protein n=1 Tax=Periconia digitata TaxID=1303443 RepID=A0A9W4U7P3_9PLEO|nr:unnamed protein product [Periconia digitata]